MRKYDEIHSQLSLESHGQNFLGSKWFQTNQFPCSFEHTLPRGTSKILQVHGFRAGGHPLDKNVHLPWVPVIVQHVLWSQHVIWCYMMFFFVVPSSHHGYGIPQNGYGMSTVNPDQWWLIIPLWCQNKPCFDHGTSVLRGTSPPDLVDQPRQSPKLTIWLWLT